MRRRTEPKSPSPRIRALDGIRAFAVLAVLASHTSGTGLPGGYFGVDAFFALSGYLITSLLVAEFAEKRTISLGAFWGRRARRLLPALFVLLAAVGIGAALWPSVFSVPDLRSDAVSTLLYFANWHLIAQHSNYFVATGQPSPLMHTWSLAIEEQFYLVWPIVVLAVLGLRRHNRPQPASDRPLCAPDRRRLEVLLALCAVGAVASAWWMARLTPDTVDTVRSYYGSDTRAQSLLAGAALAVFFALRGPVRSPRARSAVSMCATAGAVATVALWVFVPDSSELAFHGGFLLAALATCSIIACAVQAPTSLISSALSLRPIRYLGSISYGMYLWYWPVVLVMSPARTHASGYELFAMRLAADTTLAALSARAVEIPVRRAVLPAWRWSVAAPAAASLAILSVFVATIGSASAGALPEPAPRISAASSDAPAPIKVLLVGDSMAGSLGVGLSELAARYDAVVANEGSPGCSLSMDGEFQALLYDATPGPPCRTGDPQALLDTWRKWVDAWNPDVVLYLARGELFNQVIGSSPSWAHIGEEPFDARLAKRFEDALSVLGSRGASVYLLGSPVYHSGAEPLAQPSPFPEDNPARVTEDDAIMRSAVSHFPRAGFIDVGAWVTPGNRYSAEQDGVVLRCGDGVHFTAAGGRWVASRLFPLVVALARTHRETSPAGAWPGGVLPAPVPSWYPSLSC